MKSEKKTKAQTMKSEKKTKAQTMKSEKKTKAQTMKSEKKTKDGSLGSLPYHHLLPFVVGVVISFVWFLPYKPAVATMSLERMVLKCLPILYLAAYILIMDRGRGESSKVFCALILSAIGDGFLAFHDVCFIHGIIAFGMAHILYIMTFGFKTMKLVLGGALYATNFLLLSYLVLPHVQPASFRVAMSLYSPFLVTMAWRALDRYFFMTSPCVERRLCSALGAVSFLISDSSYVFLQMLGLVPHIPAQVVILSTYYLSQLLLMLGSSESFWGPGRNNPKKKV